MGKTLGTRVKELYSNKENFKSWKSYYIALSDLIKECMIFLDKDLVTEYKLDMLANLDPDQYVSRDYDTFYIEGEMNFIKCDYNISMENEIKFIEHADFKSQRSLLSSICTIMFGLVLLHPDDMCHICGCEDGCEIYYLKVNCGYPGREKVILECGICGQASNVDGSKYDDKIDNWLPATRKEVEEAYKEITL